MSGRGARSVLAQAEKGTAAWRAAARGQRSATLHHSDFYALAGELDATLRAMEDIATGLATAVLDYRQTPGLYDDSRGSWGGPPNSRPVDPRIRLSDTAASIGALALTLAEAQRHTNVFWSRIGHIGVDAPR